MNAPTPHNFLLNLRVANPEVARLLDFARMVSLEGETIVIKAPSEGWPGKELFGRIGELESLVRSFFGERCRVSLLPVPLPPETLPSPVMAGKVNNHALFWARRDGVGAALLARKPEIAKAAESKILLNGQNAVDFGAEFFRAGTISELLDTLLAKMREEFSYAHIIVPFEGHEAARELEYGLYAAKEWGTPHSPAPLLQRFIGRLHYCDPASPPGAMRSAENFLAGLG